MKRGIFTFLLFTMIITLVACSNTKSSLKPHEIEGIGPYELTEKDKYLLQSLGMDNNSFLVSINAPKDAITLKFNAYSMKNGSRWENIGGGATSIGDERIPVERLKGTFAILFKEKYAMDVIVNCGGRCLFKTNEITAETEHMESEKRFLSDFQSIKLNKEIPVALMVYDGGSSMLGYSLQDYFEPSKFKEMDLVQVVTVTFTDKELE